jgi:Flp pilus assembly protein TadD
VDTARSHHDLAQAIGAGRLDRAAALYRQANEAHPPYAQALQVLWAALEKRGMFDRAAQSVRFHQSMAPNSPVLHRTLAALYWTQGAYAKAWEEVHRCQEKGGALDAGFLRVLREKMAEPDRKTP